MDRYSDDFGGLSDVSAEEAKPLEKPQNVNNTAKQPDANRSDGFGFQALESLDSPPTLIKNEEASKQKLLKNASSLFSVEDDLPDKQDQGARRTLDHMEEYSAKITLDDQLRKELDNNKKAEESEAQKESKSKIEDEVGDLPSQVKSISVSNLKSEVISEEYSEFQSISKQSRQLA